MSLLKEFEVDNNAIEEWLSWGGITRPSVMQQKGGSCFSVIEYKEYEKTYLTKKMEIPEFRRGWAIWNERQHTQKGNRDFIVIFWNPFETKLNPYIKNTLSDKILKEKFLDYFEEEVKKIYKEISKVTEAKILKYQEIMNFLTFALMMEEKEVAMPEVPLYMDALLSQDVEIKFKANDVYVNGKRIFILTLPDFPDEWAIFDKLKRFKYRYVRRMLLFSEKESQMELKKYAGKWCPNRKIMLKEIEKGILGGFNGYCYNGFIFQVEETEYETFRAYLEEYLIEQEISFVIEKYNLKDIWWGSLPGIFLANITPPIVGFNSFEEFILHREPKNKEMKEQRFQEIIKEMEEEKANVQNGQI